jgi:hypothetical protein
MVRQQKIRTLHRRYNSGDRCECAQCQGKLSVYSTHVKPDAGVRVRYLSCDICHWRPVENKVIVPLAYAPRR